MLREQWAGLVSGYTRARQFGWFMLLPALVACAQVNYPTNSEIAHTKATTPVLTTIDDAHAYVAAAKANMQDQIDTLRWGEGAADAGIIGGGITALAGGLLHAASSVVIAGSLLAGSSLAVGQTLSMPAQMAVLDQGIEALTCVDSQVVAAASAVRDLDLALYPVQQAEANLQKAYANAIAVADKNASAGSIAAALNDQIETSRQDLDYGAKFISARENPITSVVDGARLATDEIVNVTNRQLRQAQPDPAAFSRAIQGINISTGTPSTTGATPQQKTGGAPLGGGPAPQPDPLRAPILRALTEAGEQLKEQIALFPQAAVVTANADTILSNCKQAEPAIQITPAGPISLKVKVPYDLTITGTTYSWAWNGPADPDVQITALSSSQISIIANKATQAADTYALVFTPAGGKATVVPLKAE